MIVVLPVLLALLACLPDAFGGWGILVSVATTCGGMVLLAEVGRDWGKRKEPQLFEQWKGKPTTVILRHGGPTNPVTLKRWHDKLQALLPTLKMPTAEDERRDPEGADLVYESCVGFLRERTRHSKQFPLVFQENCNYGFRRNVWGMRNMGLALAMMSMAAIIALPFVKDIAEGGLVSAIAIPCGLIDLALLLFWIGFARPEWVRTPAEAYAQRLLAACELL